MTTTIGRGKWMLIGLLPTLALLGLLAALIVAARPPDQASAAVDAIVIPYLDTGYRYKVVSPANSGVGAGFETGAEPAGFATGTAGFGTTNGVCPINTAGSVNTNWPVNTDILLRKTFTLPPGATNLKVSGAIDDKVEVFINGTLIGTFQNDGCAVKVPPDFVFTAPNGILNAGNNLLAGRCIDIFAVETYCDFEVTYTPPPPGPPAVGGIVGLRDAEGPAEASGSSSAPDGAVPIAAVVAALVVALVAGGWYARRRWLR